MTFRRHSPSFLAGLLAVTVAGCGSSAAPLLPRHTAVTLRVPAESFVATSNVGWRRGRAWFSVTAGRQLRIYRWQGAAWKLDGALEFPDNFTGPQFDGFLSFADVTGGAAPNVTVHGYGADTVWFAFAARVGARWTFVPFDDQFGARDPFTFATGAEHHLIHGMFDACGCASGPTTYQWYRFSQGVFVATDPPNGSAVCSADELSAAPHWPRLPYDPLVRNVGKTFHPARFACARGWALATDGQRVGVYEQSGRNFNQPVGRHWLLVAVGPVRLFRDDVDLAAPRSLLQRLGRKVGVRMPPAPSQPKGQGAKPLTSRQRSPITVQVRPGDSYAATDLYGSPNVLTVTVTSAAHRRTVTRFRWRDGAWVRLPSKR